MLPAKQAYNFKNQEDIMTKPEENKSAPKQEDKPAEKDTKQKKVDAPQEKAKPDVAPDDKSKNTKSSGDFQNRQSGGNRFGDNRKGGYKGGKRGQGRGRGDKPEEEFESKIVDLARVTRVMAGGKRMNFRACVVIGDKKGRIGYGLKKGVDVQLAVQKATDQAKKNIIKLDLVEGTIPHYVQCKFKGAQVLLKPAKAGTGVIAGGAVRVIMEIAGVRNIVAKIQGSSNKINNVKAVIQALGELQTKEEIEKKKSS